jgi:molybdopterin synthase sulfur carrier subunit|tara:strand:+ start:55 stop:330 length:276 start_codon:yes stop_codon:yes gene_type:complete
MQKLTNGQDILDINGATVREIIENLEQNYPGIKVRLVDKYKMKSNISVAVDGEVSPLGLLEKVSENSEVHFIPAVGGGCINNPEEVSNEKS